jgi:glycerophosphoryl diester phosphodiesterase
VTLLLGHRGDPGSHAENTLEAFAAALRCGADGVELDVQVSADGEPVVVHDATLDRTTAGSGRVDAHTWPELARLGVPHLREALQVLRGHRVAVELKPAYAAQPRLAERVLDLARAAGAEDSMLLLLAFDHRHLAAAAGHAPQVRRGALVRDLAAQDAVSLAADSGADVLAAWWELVDPPLFAALRRAGRGVVAWTVDDEAAAVALAAMGVEALISNRPCALVAALRGSG